MSTSNIQAVVWVTGASSGIGRSLALELARRGRRVIASARKRDQLEQLASEQENIDIVVCDIADEQSVQKALEEIGEISPFLDQIVLNAGTCEYLDFPEPDWSSVRRVMEVNFFGSVNCVRAALPLLRKSPGQRAHIVAVASQVTAAPFARAEAYGASKAAMQYFFESLRVDLLSENIDVSIVNPGFVDTPLTRKNDFPMPFLMDVDAAAERIVRALESRPRSYSFPTRLSALLLISKLAPRLWQKMVAPKKEYPTTESSRGAGK